MFDNRKKRTEDDLAERAFATETGERAAPQTKPKTKKRRSFPKFKVALPIWLGLLIIALAVGALFLVNYLNRPDVPDDGLYVYFIDVGQGDAALLVTSKGTVMIDAGPTDVKAKTAGFVKNHTEKIDLMILTHPHEDHIGGAAEILESVPVEKVIMPDVAADTASFVKTLDAVEKQGCAAGIASAGAIYDVGDMRLTVLAPLEIDKENINNCSIVVRVDYGKRSFLFTGDAENESELAMTDAYPAATLDCDVLKVGHHGSSSNSSEFFAAVSPEIAVISVGKGNDYGHPAEKTLRALTACGAKQILRTDKLGTVTLICDGETVKKG